MSTECNELGFGGIHIDTIGGAPAEDTVKSSHGLLLTNGWIDFERTRGKL